MTGILGSLNESGGLLFVSLILEFLDLVQITIFRIATAPSDASAQLLHDNFQQHRIKEVLRYRKLVYRAFLRQ